MICSLIWILLIIGAGGFVYGSLTDTGWAKVISALFDFSVVLSVVFGTLKRFKPRNAE